MMWREMEIRELFEYISRLVYSAENRIPWAVREHMRHAVVEGRKVTLTESAFKTGDSVSRWRRLRGWGMLNGRRRSVCRL